MLTKLATLSVTRAFGNWELGQFVTAEPELREVILLPTDTHLILACDGVSLKLYD